MARLFDTAVMAIDSFKSNTKGLHEWLKGNGYECTCGKLLANGAKCPKCNPQKES